MITCAALSLQQIIVACQKRPNVREKRPDSLFCLISGLFCLISGLFCLTLGLFCLISGLFCLISGLFCLILGLFCLISGLFCLSHVRDLFSTTILFMCISYTHKQDRHYIIFFHFFSFFSNSISCTHFFSIYT